MAVTGRDAALAAVGVGAIAFAAVYVRTTSTGAADAGAPEPITAVPSDRVTLAPDAQPAPAFIVDGGIDGGLSRACMAMMAANSATVSGAASGQCHGEESELGCATTRDGVTWGWEVVAVTVTDNNSAPPDSGEWSDVWCETAEQVRLVRADRTGAKTAGPTEEVSRNMFETHTRSVTALVDYDGDGEIEVLREAGGHLHEGGPIDEAKVLTFARGAIGDYAPAAGHDLVSVVDADGDGRPDLVTRGPYNSVMNDVFGNSWPAGPAMFLAHSRPDGTFAIGDPESMAYTRTQCPKRPALSFSHEDLVFARGAEERIVCARLRGASRAEIDRAYDAVCTAAQDASAGPGDMACEAWPKELAAIAPPFALK